MADAEAVRARAEARRAKLLAKSEDRLKAIEKREVTKGEGGDGNEAVEASGGQPASAPAPDVTQQPAQKAAPASPQKTSVESAGAKSSAAGASAATAPAGIEGEKKPQQAEVAPPSNASSVDKKKPVITGDLPPLVERRSAAGEASVSAAAAAAQADALSDSAASAAPARPPRPRTRVELAHVVLRGSELYRTAAALLMGVILGAIVLRTQPAITFLAMELCAVAAGAQLLASTPAGDGKSAFAKWLARSGGGADGLSASAGAGDPQPQWLRTGLSVLGMFAPELKARVPSLLGGLRVCGAVADDFAVFAVAFLLSRYMAAGPITAS